jgi:hypothetical protein
MSDQIVPAMTEALIGQWAAASFQAMNDDPNLGAAVAGQGRRAGAEALTARAAAILTARLPRDHPHLMAAREAPQGLRRTS